VVPSSKEWAARSISRSGVSFRSSSIETIAFLLGRGIRKVVRSSTGVWLGLRDPRVCERVRVCAASSSRPASCARFGEEAGGL
jgi:hypothetical protein